MGELVLTMKFVVAFLIVSGLVLTIIAVLQLGGRELALTKNQRLFILGVLAVIDFFLLLVGYVAFFVRLG
ncbi:hypothetical protein EPN96_02510 [bacterium]|nr:MAG: hypothetical protein EPN96_02510 [bacterium]